MKGSSKIKMKRWILIFAAVGLATFTLEAHTMRADSVGVEKVGGKSYIIHQVAPQETLFGISRRYSTPVNDIVQSNDNLKDGLKIGQRIRVPYIEKEAIPKDALVHQVIPGETLFAIAQSYNVALQDLKAWNNLQGNDLSIGQSLIIKGLAVKDEPVGEEKIDETVAVADRKVAVTKEQVNRAEANQQKEKPDPRASMPANGKIEAASPSPKAKEMATSTPDRVKPSEKSDVSTTGNWLSHKVGQGETLFSIAQRYDAKVEELINWNGLSSNNLAIGQTLKVGRETNASIPVTRFPKPESKPSAPTVAKIPTNTQPTKSPSSSASSTSSASSGGSSASGAGNVAPSTAYKNVRENGQAEVIEGTGNHKKYLVLHRTAPVGTIMRIRNEENDVTVFARVVGVLPNTGDNDKLLIKVSKAAFDQLKAVNSRFRVEVAY